MLKLKHCYKQLKPQVNMLVVLIIILNCFTACSNKIEDLPNTDNSIFEQERANNVTFLFGQDGNTKAKLFTKHFNRHESAIPPFIDMTDSVYVEFYNNNLEVQNRLSAKKARFYTQSEDIIINDSVVITTKDGKIIETEELIWNAKIEKIYSDKPVKIIQGENITYGTGLEANQSISWIIIHNLRGNMPVDNEKMNQEVNDVQNKE